jgi:hypothetical protein
MENETRELTSDKLFYSLINFKSIYDPKLIFPESLMMNLRSSHIICGKMWISHREKCV